MFLVLLIALEQSIPVKGPAWDPRRFSGGSVFENASMAFINFHSKDKNNSMPVKMKQNTENSAQ